MKHFHNKSLLPDCDFNPYTDGFGDRFAHKEVTVLNGSLPKVLYKLLGSQKKCCICGFMSNKGIITKDGFVCLTDFENENMFSSVKVIAPNGVHYNPKKTLDNWRSE